jgi:putative heme iron utilization protein
MSQPTAKPVSEPASARPHARGAPPPDPRRPSYAEEARTLLERSTHGVLATLDASGYPYPSVVELLPLEGDALFLLSDLAEHTRNLRRDARASLLLTAGVSRERVLAGARVSLIGSLAEEDGARYREAYRRLHPDAATYLTFSDFRFYRLRPERAYFIGGFGRMGWVDEASYRQAQPDPLLEAASAIIAHMNEDHEQHLVQCARAFANISWATHATMLTVDRYGFDVEVRGGADEEERVRTIRLNFEKPVCDPREVREAMVQLVNAARAALGT